MALRTGGENYGLIQIMETWDPCIIAISEGDMIILPSRYYLSVLEMVSMNSCHDPCAVEYLH